MDQLTTPPKRLGRYQHSQQVSERKRTLFPSQENDNDSDLGHMSPLENSSSPERYETLLKVSKSDNVDFRYFTFFDRFKKNKANNENEEIHNPEPDVLSPIFDKYAQNDIPEILAPNTPTPTDSPEKNRDTTFIPETPVKSPTAILKTPHDNSSTNLQLPRLVRKSLLDISNIDKSNLKRKSDSPVENASNKSFKLDHFAQKPPKARTALFIENSENENDTMFSAKSFYGKTENSKLDVSFRQESSAKLKSIARKPAPVYLCSRGNGKNKRKYFGQINAGVRHGIRKPRKPTLTKTQLLKAALNIVKNSPLNDILDNVSDSQSNSSENECGVSLEQIKKMDSILKNLDSPILSKPLTIFARPETPTAEQSLQKVESCFGLKRPLSPEQESKRKFFKSSPSRATIEITGNIKLSLDHGELSIIERQNKIKKPRKAPIIDFDMSDLSFNEEKIIDHSFTDIFKCLEDDKLEEDKKFADTKNLENILSAIQNTDSSSNHSIENSTTSGQMINKHIIINKDIILSPTSLMCDLTSGLALDSPKSQTSLNSEIDLKKASFKKCISFPETMAEETNSKLFPIFYGKQSAPKQEKKESRHVKNIRKIWKPLSEDQTLIDAGQKRFGVTQCPECKIIYSIGEPDDEIMHFNYHNNISVFKYHSWKHERVVNQFSGGKVIQVNPNDPKTWWKKVKEVIEVVNKELGFVDLPFVCDNNQKVFLCIVNKQIVGCLVAEPKTQGYKMISSSDGVDYCSEESYSIKCGVSRIWVAQPHRVKGIATCMMNAMRSHFMYGHIMSINEIAFSAPTELGKKFAGKYTKTSSFLIYTS